MQVSVTFAILARKGKIMDEFWKNLLLFALGVGLAIALFYVWEQIGPMSKNPQAVSKTLFPAQPQY